MTPSRISARELNQNKAKAKRLAEEGPVIITDRGEPAYVLITYEEFRRSQGASSILAALSPTADMVDVADIEFEGLTVVTRNAGDFRRIDGLGILNPWES